MQFLYDTYYITYDFDLSNSTSKEADQSDIAATRLALHSVPVGECC